MKKTAKILTTALVAAAMLASSASAAVGDIKVKTGGVTKAPVQDGKITRNSQIRIVRDGVVIAEDKISSLKRFKDDMREVSSGYECGVGLEKFNDIHEGDILEAFIMEEVAK